MAEIAERHQANAAQIALSWLLARDSSIIPIPGATKVMHARANIGALTVKLSEEEFVRIDKASES